MFYSTSFAYGLGVFLAVAFIDATRQMQPRGAWNLLCWMIAVVVAGFVAFPLERGDITSFTYEVAILVVLGMLLLAARRWRSSALLALVYFAHGLSDLFHLRESLPVCSPRWVHELCVPFDWILAAWIVIRRASFATLTS